MSAMNDWAPERIKHQRDLAVTGRAGIWILLEGGPRHGSRAFIPHLDWPFLVVLDAQGATWSFANPPGHVAAPEGATLVGTYVFDRQREVMTWRPSDGVILDVPSMRWTRS